MKILWIAVFGICMSACTKVNVLEKNVFMKDHAWSSSVKPSINFIIEDTTSLYNVYITVRHFDAYNYNNIWIKCTVRNPGSPATTTQQYNLTLATNEKGWLGTGMDDIYENRILIQPRTKFTQPGEYNFILEQIMREDPLKHVLNVGLRIEKAGEES